ncbi:hypothetical protein Tco_0983048 [Tanacetum coccineum]
MINQVTPPDTCSVQAPSGGVTVPIPPTTDTVNAVNMELWETCNNMVISWIMSYVSNSIAKSIMFIGTACGIWTQLEIRFSLSNGTRKYKLSKECFEIQQNNSSRSQLLLINPLPSIENACAVIQQEESQKDVFHTGVSSIESTTLFSKLDTKGKCSICSFKWHPPEKCWEKVGYPIWHH